MRRTSSRGVTLIELMVSMFTFGLLLAAVFLLFGLGSRGFRTVESRQSAQNQLAALRAALQRDLQMTHFYSLAVDGSVAERDALSAVAVSDWNDAEARDAYGVPLWDQWVVYRVTREERGQLLRHVVVPAGGRGRTLLRPADGLAQLARAVAPHDLSWARVSAPQVLVRGVRSLRATLDQELRGISLEVTIEQPTDAKNPKNDVITATFFVKPHNTVPTD